MNIIQFIIGLFTGKAGGSVGSAVSVVAQIAAAAAAIAPIGLWLVNNKDAVFISLTYGDLAFWGLIVGAQIIMVLRLVHRAPPPV